MSTLRSRRAELRLHPLAGNEETLPDSIDGIPRMLMQWGMHREVQECLWVIAYDASLGVRNVVEASRGTPVGTTLHIPTVLQAVLTSGSERFMLAHNHPGGGITPSSADKSMTIAVMNAANTCGLYFEDHYIVTPQGQWFSFRDSGFLVPAEYGTYVAAET